MKKNKETQTSNIKSITNIDQDYLSWVKELASRYKQCQIKAAVKVNTELLMFYWQLGKDIVNLRAEERWGEGVIKQLCMDLQKELPNITGFSNTNVYYCKKFYLLYNQVFINFPQVGGNLDSTFNFSNGTQLKEQFMKDLKPLQTAEKLTSNHKSSQLFFEIFLVPWGHHKLIIDKFKNDVNKALFYIRKTLENEWSRSTLAHWINSNLYEREGKALSNFNHTLPAPMSDLANEITKDPYNFAFIGITQKYNESQLKSALIQNITNFLLELGSGFAYVGKEYRLQIGKTEKFIDLLFYHLQLRCYVVIEVKTEKFDFQDMGQIGGYVVACNHLLKRTEDNPTIGLLICKDKDNLLAQYSLESSNQPIAISQYDLARLYPAKVEGLIPSIEEIETRLSEKNNPEHPQGAKAM